jgi:tetratricopeptide (TPR) repeat protein
MSILDRILGNKPGTTPPLNPNRRQAPVTELPAAVAGKPGANTTAATGERPVRVYDQFGRKLEIGREAWRRDVLLPNLAANRDKPDALFDLINGALNDDFAADVLESARHLASIDPKPPRAAALLGVTLLQLADHAGARDVFERALAKHGDTPHLLANLARTYEAAGDHEKALELIWRALQLDPNEGTSLGWLATAANMQGGQETLVKAYARAAELPGSWRAQLWLARFALERGDVAEATRLYEEALGRAQPIPADLLMQMSGDLGNRGHAELLIRLTQPRFDFATHGLMVGNNLLRAFIDLGMLAEARKLLEQLYSLQRPDWREPLASWERRLDDASRRYGEVAGPLEILMMCLEEPVWARGVLGFETLLPVKAATAPRIDFVCASGEGPSIADTGIVKSQPTNEIGRLARALPLFMSEELFLRTNAKAHFVLPWMKQGGFILSARPWTRESMPAESAPADAFVFMHIEAAQTPWKLKVSIDVPARPKESVTLELNFSLQTSAHDTLTLLHELMARLSALLSLRREEHGASLAPPPADLLPAYLIGIEQALAVGLAARAPGGDASLYQERAIFDHLLEVALQGGETLRPRLLLINALENQARRRPDIAREYVDKLALLQQRLPITDASGELVARAVATVTQKARRAG